MMELGCYNFKYSRRGTCLLINNEKFDQRLTSQTDREGTNVDADNVERVFANMGFEVERYDNLRKIEMSIRFRETALKDHHDAACFACVILSHGNEGVVYGTDGTVKLSELLRNFKGDLCPELAGKPKLFFIQACRGKHYDWGVEIDETDAKAEMKVQKIPVEADFLMAYSVSPGYFSWRNNVDGSWFVQALCRVLEGEDTSSLDIQRAMTLVCKIVAHEFQSCTDTEFTDSMKQVPFIASTLTSLVFLKAGKAD